MIEIISSIANLKFFSCCKNCFKSISFLALRILPISIKIQHNFVFMHL
nr:MAG TPA: hypothetical protein [Caudoviricetes sp.]